MKQYPKTFEDRYRRPSEVVISKIGAKDGSIDALVLKTKGFYREVNSIFFDFIVKAVWLNSQFIYDNGGSRYINKNGFIPDTAFAFFMKGMVGYNQKLLLDNGVYYKIESYFNDFFPKFFDHDPFLEPKYFAFPYKHISLDHLILVSECDDRLEMLAYADKHEMNIRDFTNWAVNWACSYNIEVGKTVYKYTDSFRDRRSPILRKVKK